MAKSSARSKGYRSFNKKAKEAKNARDNKTILVGTIVFVVAVLLVVIGVNVFDKIGTIPVKDDYIQAEDTWIVRNMGTSYDPRVKKMAEVSGPAEGFEMTVPSREIRQSQFHTFDAIDENAKVTHYYMGMANGDYTKISAESYLNMSTFGTQLYATDIMETEINGHKCIYYSLQYELDNSEAQDGSDMGYYQCMNAYFDVKQKDTSLLISVGDKVSGPDAFATDEELMAVLEQAFATVTLK